MSYALLLLYLPVCLVSSAAASGNFEQLFREGLIALQRGELEAAETSLQQASSIQPANGRVWIALSQTWWKLHEPAKAEKAAARASALSPSDPAVLQSLVVYYSESGQTLKAAEAQVAYAEASSGNPGALGRAAELYFEAARPLLQHEQFADAIAVLRPANSKIRGNAQLQVALGTAYYGLRRFDEAAEAFFSAISLAPEARQPYLFLGRMLDQIPGRLPEATERFAAFEKASPGDDQGYFLHARALDAQMLEPDTARKLLEKSLAINDANAEAHFELGALLERLRRFPEAAAELERAAVLQPSDPATHYHLSRVYERLDKPEAAATERDRHRQLITAQNTMR